MLHIGETLTREIQHNLSPHEMAILEHEYHKRKKHPGLALILSFFFGCLAIDRFYIRDYGTAITKLIVCVVCSILFFLIIPTIIVIIIWVVDMLKIMKATESENHKSLYMVYQKILAQKKCAAQRHS